MRPYASGLITGLAIGLGTAIAIPVVAGSFSTYVEGDKVITQSSAYAYVNALPDANCMVDPIAPVISSELQIWCQ